MQLIIEPKTAKDENKINKLMPEINIRDIQTNTIKIVWPMSG